MEKFDHERLDVYHLAIEFVKGADELVKDCPPGRAYLCDQLQRAATSIVLNIAEGAGEFSRKQRRAFIGSRAGLPRSVQPSWTSAAHSDSRMKLVSRTGKEN